MSGSFSWGGGTVGYGSQYWVGDDDLMATAYTGGVTAGISIGGFAETTYTFVPGTLTTLTPGGGGGGGGTLGFSGGVTPSGPGTIISVPDPGAPGTFTLNGGGATWGGIGVDSSSTISINGTGTINFVNDDGVMINVNQGTLNISNPVNFLSSGSNTVGTITLNSSTAISFTGQVTGDASFTINQEGFGTANFTNLSVSTYNIDGGTLNLADPNGGAATASIGQLTSSALSGVVNVGGGSGPSTLTATVVSVPTLNIGASGSGNVTATIGQLLSPAANLGVVNVGGGSGSAVLTVTQLALPTLNIGSSGSVVIASGGGTAGTGSISSLTIASGAQLDITDHGLVIEYGPNGTSPIGDLSYGTTARNYPAGSIQRYIQTAVDGLNWDGPGITSSTAANDPDGVTAVGAADENDLDNVYPADYTVAGGGTGTWMGQPVNDTNNVLVRYTYYGDGNLDGVVNRYDETALSQGYSGLAGYIGWSDGDYSYAGYISTLDISLFSLGYTFQGAPLGDAITPGQATYLLALDPSMAPAAKTFFEAIAAGETPEPASSALVATGIIGLLARRRVSRTAAPK
jgi:hypothetical protein